jgi:hypothetical protein
MQTLGERAAGSRAPRTWLVLGEKAGDNAQVRAIADALPWPCETRRIAMQERWRFGKPRVRASIEHVDRAASDPLEPPWPDLVITIGRRLSSVALWIGEQSGGATKLVLIGWPRRLAQRFDLIVASAQYRGGERPNVVRLALPLMRVDRAAVESAARTWAPRLASLARPLTAVLVGGPTKPVIFDAAQARALIERAAAVADGGTLYVTTSRRTPPALVEAIAACLPPGAQLYRFGADAADNPYLGLLGCADRFVATSDSITMMVEVARLGRPLAVHVLPPRRRWLRRFASHRDLEAVPAWLIERGYAVHLGEPFRAPTDAPPDEVARVVERIRALCGVS